MRGEYYLQMRGEWEQTELPPHARRIQRPVVDPVLAGGTTSACAENTSPQPCRRHGGWNYLRMRGEYGKPISRGEVSMELPPHARRIHSRLHIVYMNFGTTSACAENTRNRFRSPETRRNYLRMRGEYSRVSATPPALVELPPHARRIHRGFPFQLLGLGTTSACAENT